jgi:hypothetical protein
VQLASIIIAIMADANNARDQSSLLWGYSLPFWDWIGVKALIGGVILGVIALLLTAASAYILYRVADEAQIALAKESKRSSERIAELHNETARFGALAAQANQKAEEERLARLKIEETLIHSRWLTGEQQSALKAEVEKFPGIIVEIWVYPVGAPDADGFGMILALLMKNAGWSVSRWLMQVGFPSHGGVLITWRDGPELNKNAALGLLSILKAAGISAVAPGPFEANDDAIGPQISAVIEDEQKPTMKPTIRIFVGSKLNAL